LRKSHRRLGVVLAAAIAALTLAAAPAYAHFCMKTGWSDAAVQHAATSPVWMTQAEWLAFIDWAVESDEICPAGADVLRAQITSAGEDTLFMGPGLLAGGTLKNGKGNTPGQFDYLDFESAFAACTP